MTDFATDSKDQFYRLTCLINKFLNNVCVQHLKKFSIMFVYNIQNLDFINYSNFKFILTSQLSKSDNNIGI